MTRPLPNVSEAYYMLLQEEHQREMSSEVHMVPQSAALYNSNYHCQQVSLGKNLGYNNLGKATGYKSNLSGNNRYPLYPNSGNGSGNDSHSYNGNQSFKNPAVRRQLFCDHCKLTGHTVQKCYKLHGYPPGHRLHKGKRMAASVTQDQEGVSWLEEGQCNSSS